MLNGAYTWVPFRIPLLSCDCCRTPSLRWAPLIFQRPPLAQTAPAFASPSRLNELPQTLTGMSTGAYTWVPFKMPLLS